MSPAIADPINLYHDATAYFVYADVAIEPTEAAEAITWIKGYYGHFQGEVRHCDNLSAVKQEPART